MGKQPAAGGKKTKEQIAKAAAASNKAGKKKWTKGKVKDKANHAVFFDDVLYKRIVDETPKMKLITVATLIDKFKMNGTLARQAIKHLTEKKLIKPVGDQSASFKLYTTTVEKK